MSQLPANAPKPPLPSIEDLYEEKAIEIATRHNDLNKLLNRPPKREWIVPHPIAKKKIQTKEGEVEVPVESIPIGILEYLMTSIYTKWKREVKNVFTIANSIVVVIRVWYLDPVTGDWDWTEGAGAAPIRTKKGASATDFSQVQDSSVQTGVPAATSYAFKDAVENLGKIFGKDLNRNAVMDYTAMQESKFKEKPTELPDGLILAIEAADQENLSAIYKNNPEYHHLPQLMQLINARKIELRAEKPQQ